MGLLRLRVTEMKGEKKKCKLLLQYNNILAPEALSAQSITKIQTKKREN